MATLYTHKSENIRKTWILMIAFFVGVIAIGYGVSWFYNDPSILYIAVALALFMNFASYWWSDKLVITMTGARPIEKADDPEYWNVVENLAITAGLPMPKPYIVIDPAPNAFATGRNPEHAVICVTSGLRQIMSKTELEGVLAHELSHVGNRDMLVSTVAVVLAGFIAILSDLFLRMSMFGGRDDRDRGQLGAVIMVVGIVLAILAPIAATLIQLAISRKREYLADASGALLTRYPEGLASALQKIGAYQRPMRRANQATAHLFIANPFGPEGMRGFIGNLFSTHPPIQARIEALLGKSQDLP
jgi:heat shock protein HtpX